MSYCRWSSDDFGCDIYCYENVGGGYTTHVANSRVVGEVPKLPFDEKRGFLVDSESFAAAYRAQLDYVASAPRVLIGLMHDGQTFYDPTLSDFRLRLMHLREVGYRFPDEVLKRIEQEMMLL